MDLPKQSTPDEFQQIGQIPEWCQCGFHNADAISQPAAVSIGVFNIGVFTLSGQFPGSGPCCARKAHTSRSSPKPMHTLCAGPEPSTLIPNARPKKSV